MQLQLGRTGVPPAVQEGDVVLAVRDAAGDEEEQRLHVRCVLESAGERVQVAGAIAGSAQSHCHRCLAAFERPVQVSFTLLVQRGGEREAEDVLLIAESAEAVDLTPILREAVILEEPIRLLCREDCRGLCSQCGQDLNVATCACAPVSGPRPEALERLAQDWEP